LTKNTNDFRYLKTASSCRGAPLRLRLVLGSIEAEKKAISPALQPRSASHVPSTRARSRPPTKSHLMREDRSLKRLWSSRSRADS